MNGELGSSEPICAKLPYVPQTPSVMPSDDESAADARKSFAPEAASPEPESLPFVNATLIVVESE